MWVVFYYKKILGEVVAGTVATRTIFLLGHRCQVSRGLSFSMSDFLYFLSSNRLNVNKRRLLGRKINIKDCEDSEEMKPFVHAPLALMPRPPTVYVNNMFNRDLSNNELHWLDKGTFESLTNLRELHLQRNNLSYVAPETFSTLISLDFL